VVIKFHTLSTTEIGESKWSAARPVQFISRVKKPWYPWNRRVHEPHGPAVEKRKTLVNQSTDTSSNYSFYIM
jgi:hypothetical protein